MAHIGPLHICMEFWHLSNLKGNKVGYNWYFYHPFLGKPKCQPLMKNPNSWFLIGSIQIITNLMRVSLLIYSPMILWFLFKNRSSYWLMERPRPKDQTLLPGAELGKGPAAVMPSKESRRKPSGSGCCREQPSTESSSDGCWKWGGFGAQGLRSSSGILEPSETLKKHGFQSAIKIQEW